MHFHKEKIVAILHDTIEDGNITPNYLLEEGFNKEIAEAVISVSRMEGESYEEFIKRSKKESYRTKRENYESEG